MGETEGLHYVCAALLRMMRCGSLPAAQAFCNCLVMYEGRPGRVPAHVIANVKLVSADVKAYREVKAKEEEERQKRITAERAAQLLPGAQVAISGAAEGGAVAAALMGNDGSAAAGTDAIAPGADAGA